MLWVVAGAAGDFVALGMASSALVTALGGTAAMLCNVCLAQRMNHEAFARRDTLCLAPVVLGALLVSVLSPPLFGSLAELRSHLASGSFVAWCAGLLCLTCAAAAPWSPPRSASRTAVASGAAGSFSVLSASVLSLAADESLRGGGGGVPAAVFCLPAASTLLFVVAQVHLLNRALESGDVILIYTVFQAAWSGFTTATCVFLYGSHAAVLVGLALMFAGSAAMHYYRSSSTHYSVALDKAPPCGETKT